MHIYSLAAISTLYFLEHRKQQIDLEYLRRTEKNYFGNSSYGGNGIAGSIEGGGGGGGVGGSGESGFVGNGIHNDGNYWTEDRHNSKKVNFFKTLMKIYWRSVSIQLTQSNNFYSTF